MSISSLPVYVTRSVEEVSIIIHLYGYRSNLRPGPCTSGLIRLGVLDAVYVNKGAMARRHGESRYDVSKILGGVSDSALYGEYGKDGRMLTIFGTSNSWLRYTNRIRF